MRAAPTVPQARPAPHPGFMHSRFPVVLVGYDLEETRMLSYGAVLQKHRKRGRVLGGEGA